MRLLLLLISLALFPGAAQEHYAVVVASGSEIDSLDPDALRDIFLRRKNFEAGVRLVPVNLLGDERARIEFEERILQMDREEINRYWISNHFQGIKPPTTQASLQSIKLFVERVEGAIGYLPADMVDAQLKVIHEF